MFRALSLHLCLLSDAGSLALAIDGAARCLATGDPAVVSVQCQLLSGVKSQSVESSVQEAYTPLKSSLLVIFGLVFFTVASPFLIHIIVFRLEIHTLLPLGSL